ncbi:MAG: hypothetical protein ACE5I7_06865 [Candidatus Binatia bacterium]
MPSRGKTWLFRLSAVSLGVAVAFLAAEAFLRAWDAVHHEPSPTATIYAFCATRHHCLLPNARYRHSSYEFDYVWTNNALGMRDRPHARRKAPGTFRILFLGDSFIEGHGVRLRETIVSRLEASLNRPSRAQNIEILNAGVFGYSPILEYLYLREIFDSVEPDLVIVGFFLGNDVGEDYFYTHKARFAPAGEAASFHDHDWPWSIIERALDGDTMSPSALGSAAPHGGAWWPLAKDALRHSRALTLVKHRLDGLRYPQRRAREFALVRKHRGDIRYDLGVVNYPVLSRRKRSAYWRFSKKYLEKIVTFCRAHGAQTVLLVIPPVERLNGQTQFDEPYRVLDTIGGKLAIPVVQLLLDFLGRNPESLYYKFDRHWTAKGHELAAKVLDRELRRLDVLPPVQRRTHA